MIDKETLLGKVKKWENFWLEMGDGVELVLDGTSFIVVMVGEWVAKVPKKDHVKDEERLRRIAELQSELAAKVDGILPCEWKGKYLLMPRVRGLRGDMLEGQKKERAMEERDRIFGEARELGYVIGDKSMKNVILVEEEDKGYVIDLDSARKEGEVSLKWKKTRRKGVTIVEYGTINER